MSIIWINLFLLTFALVFAVESVPSVRDSVSNAQKSHRKKTSAVNENERSKFTEELLVRPLPSGHVYSHFEFTTTWSNPSIRAAIENYKDFDFPTYDLFPRALGEVIERYHVRELHLSLTQGLWRHHKWGYPVVDAPPGATLWAWFNPAPQEELDQTWRDLVNALSGLFCASLNFIDATNTASPALSFRPAGLAEPWYAGNSSFLRYSALARENVCTENLTPWKKLLPCDTKAGLASILFPGPLYSAHYHSLGVHLRPACQDGGVCHTPHLELVLSVSLVQHRLQDGRQDFTLRHLYSSPLFSSCPLADQSILYVDVTGNEDLSKFNLSPAPDRIASSGSADDDEDPSRRSLAVYDLRQLLLSTKDAVNVAVRWARPHVYGLVPAPPLLATRYIAGYGQEGGSIRVVLTNTGPLNVSVVYLELLPWYLRLYLHPTHQDSSVGYLSQLVTARDRERGWVYESVVTVPAGQTVELSLAFTRALLKWLEYPPDANHGFYLPAATLSFQLSQPRNVSVNARDTRTLLDKLQVSSGPSFVRLHTETLLVSLPTPDFSMPYNVICLACTVVALAFGPIHNITTKRLTLKKIESGNSVLSSLAAKLKRLLRIKAKETEAAVTSSVGEQELVSDGQTPGLKDPTDGDRPDLSGSSAGEEEESGSTSEPEGGTSEPEGDIVETRAQQQQQSLGQQQQDDKEDPPNKPQLRKRTRLRQER